MKIAVIGASGLIGSKLVILLRQRGQEVVEASLANGVNTISGEGLSQALTDGEVVVDVTNSPSYEDKAVLEFFQTSGQNLIAAEVKAGVKHHVVLSIVGTDRMQESGYYRGKLVQERLVQTSPIPYTILRSTQFFEFLRGIANSNTVGETASVPAALVQPVAADDVVAALADIALSAPMNGIAEIAGPKQASLAELVRRYLIETGDARKVVADANARYFGAVLNDQSLTPGANARIGSQTFDTWLSKFMVKT